MKWTHLTDEQLTRLAECRSKRADILPIAKCYMDEKGYSPEDALVITLEHLSSNSQFFDLTEDEWTKYTKQLYNVPRKVVIG